MRLREIVMCHTGSHSWQGAESGLGHSPPDFKAFVFENHAILISSVSCTHEIVNMLDKVSNYQGDIVLFSLSMNQNDSYKCVLHWPLLLGPL